MDWLKVLLAYNPYLIWTPRRGIIAGPWAGRQPTFTRATAKYSLGDDGLYRLLPAGALDPYGVHNATTNLAFRSMQFNQDLSQMAATALSDGPIVGKTAYNLADNAVSGEHYRGISSNGSLPASTIVSCWIVRKPSANPITYFRLEAADSAYTTVMRAIFTWDASGKPQFDSWNNVGSPSPSLLGIRQLANGWWAIYIRWTNATASTLAQRIQTLDGSKNASYAGPLGSIDCAYWGSWSHGAMTYSDIPPIETNDSSATCNGDSVNLPSGLTQYLTRPFTMLAVADRLTPSAGFYNVCASIFWAYSADYVSHTLSYGNRIDTDVYINSKRARVYTGNIYDYDSLICHASTYKPNELVVAGNGSIIGTSTSCDSMPSANGNISIGSSGAEGSRIRLAVILPWLPKDELVRLTGLLSRVAA